MQCAPRLKTLVGAFESENIAEAAIRELRAVGFSQTQIGFVSQGHRLNTFVLSGRTFGPGMETRWGLTAHAADAPGVGPTVAGGMLATLFRSTVTIGPASALVGLGLSDEDAQHYEDRLRAGHTIVTVAGGTRTDIASSVLNRFNEMNQTVARATYRIGMTAAS